MSPLLRFFSSRPRCGSPRKETRPEWTLSRRSRTRAKCASVVAWPFSRAKARALSRQRAKSKRRSLLEFSARAQVPTVYEKCGSFRVVVPVLVSANSNQELGISSKLPFFTEARPKYMKGVDSESMVSVDPPRLVGARISTRRNGTCQKENALRR